MDIVGTSLSAAQTLLAALRCPQLKDIFRFCGYESQLEKLKVTVEEVTAVLLDAQRKIELSEQAQILIEVLKDVVFEADDLLDEFVTFAEQKRILKVENRVSEKVRIFFSGSNPLGVAYKMSKGVKKIRKKLDAIAYTKQFTFAHDPAPIRVRSRETCWYVNEFDIIGRDDDLERIVGTLLDDSTAQQEVSFLSIAGISGLGKTALAQLVFNDRRVKSAFPLRLWTCVADQDQKQLDVKYILSRIVDGHQDGFTIEQVQSQLRLKLAGRKYLLVLDDVWTENRNQWCKLVNHLIGGGIGSWIVITTRSQMTATIINGQKYELSGLSKDESWRLFKRIAFASDQHSPPDDLVTIGRDIVDGCAGVPLAIRVAGSLVFGQEKAKWQSVRNIGITNIEDDFNDIMPVLKLSFDHLPSPLKSCFSYCALFPRGFRIQKEMLINLWIAQSYIVPLEGGQSMGDVAEEYFSIFLRRYFFQDIVKDEYGEVESFKIHDLMHDMAESVSGKEIYALTSHGFEGNLKFRHLSIAGTREYGKYPLDAHTRSHLFLDSMVCSSYPVEALVSRCRWLRVLDLANLDLKRLPSLIGELLHLRYLDLSGNENLVVLPESITKLFNLQTLKLSACKKLKELPKKLSKLAKLRVLDIRCCYGLTYMPRDMGMLTNLERLKGSYIVGGDGRYSSHKEFCELEDLKTLNNLKGELEIYIRLPENLVKEGSWSWKKGSYLTSKEHLNRIVLSFKNHDKSDGIIRIMEELQPHPNLKELVVKGYTGAKMPGWATSTSLPHLKCLHLIDCEELEYLPFFQSLEELQLHNAPKLKGCSIEEVVGVEESSSSSSNPQFQQSLPHFSLLKTLHINNCPQLMYVSCPCLEGLIIENHDEMKGLPNWIQYLSNLRTLEIKNCINLNAMPDWMPRLTSMCEIRIIDCSKQLQERCQTSTGEDWHLIQNIPYIHIRIVESVAEGVSDVEPGDHVLPVFTGECKECAHCKSEESNMCDLNTDRV